MADPVLCVRDTRGVATITLNRPDKHNAFDDRTIAALTTCLAELDAAPEVRVVVLTGAGQSFSSGADLEWMRSMAEYDEVRNRDDAMRLATLMATLNGFDKPTVARVNGAAYGGGVGLVACCDIAIAAAHAEFALSEIRLGLVPAVISPYVVGAIGSRQARRYFATGERIDAATAQALGLVHEAVPAEALDSGVRDIVDALLAGGPAAQRTSKALIGRLGRSPDNDQATLRHTAELIARLRVSAEGQEGLRAFLDRRSPSWRAG